MATRTKLRVRASMGPQRMTARALHAAPIRAARASMDGILKNLALVVKGFDRASPAILRQVFYPTLKLSQSRVPFDTGALHASAFLKVESVRNRPTVTLGYGRSNPPGFKNPDGSPRRPRDYAAEVHENPAGYRYKPPGQPKFLETALMEDSVNYPSRLKNLYANLMK